MNIMDAFKKVTESIWSKTEENLNDKVDKIDGKSLSTNDYTTADRQAVQSIATDLTLLDGKLYLSKDGELLSSGVTLPGGGGSGDSSSGSITLVNELESSIITAALDSDVLLKFNYSSSEDESENGTAYVYVNDVLKLTATITPGSNTINIGQYVGEGTSVVKLTCVDIYSNSKSLQFSTNIVSLRITSTFTDGQVYNGDINVRYIPYGAVEKDIHFILNGVEDIVTTAETGKQQTYTIPVLSHGTYPLQIYMTAEINGTTVTSNILNYEIMAVEDNVTTPLISSVYTVETVTQGELVSIPFTVYDPINLETQITLSILKDGEVYSENTRTVDSTRQTWNIRDYPVGQVSFVITYGAISKVHVVTVVKNSINVVVKESDLEFQLISAGRSNADDDKNIWSDGDVTTTFEYVNWDSSGWVEDNNGDVVLRLFGDAKATINFQPFKTDARATGRTLEFVYAIRDVNNRDAVAISCLSNGIGFAATADMAQISSEQTSVNCRYTDEEKLYVTFVIEPTTEYRLMSVYLNGILSGVQQYPSGDNLQQNPNVNITLGSEYCSVDIYAIRSYSTALTHDEVRNNYIASIADLNEKLAIYDDNDIYDIYGNLSFNELKDKICTMTITGDLPTYKGDKRSVSISYIDPFNESLSFSDTASIDVQGTSSAGYIRKNWKIKASNSHQWAESQMAGKVYCLKVDYAENTGTHNTVCANYVHTLYGDAKTPPQETDDRCRSVIYGHPCVLFHKADAASEPEFLGKANFNWDKGAENVFGFSEDYPDARCWEFCNNTSDACLFHGPVPDDFGDDFEARYPDGSKDIESFKTMHNWVVSTWQDGATGDNLESEYIADDGTVYTMDTAEYRLAKFKKEFTEHFDLDFMLVYYVFTLVMLMVDQRAKNMFLTTWDGTHWQPWLYDNDTCLGINNEGQLVFDYYHLDTDVLDGANVYNGQTSALWVNFRESFGEEIATLYAEWRSSKLLTFDKLIDAFITNHSDHWSAAVYTEDSDYKYISMVRSDNNSTYLFQVRGNGEYHLRYFLDSRLMFLDSKFNCGDYPSDEITLRLYSPNGEVTVEPNHDFTLTSFSNVYLGVRYKANGALMQQRVEKNTPTLFEAPDETFNDTETYLYPASEISSIGNISPMYVGYLDVSKATKLTELIIGAGEEYSNPNFTGLSVGSNNLLKKIDVRNCPNLTEPLAISNCPSIETILAEGSGITSVELPSSGFLRTIHLPSTITNITITNQQYIEDFQCESYDSLTTLRVENSIGVPIETIINTATNLTRVRLIDAVWTAESEEQFAITINRFKSCLGLDGNGQNTDQAVITGYVYVPSISDELYADCYENFPSLVIEDNSGTPYIINFLNRNGETLYITRVAKGTDVVDPIEAGLIGRPEDIVTDEYTYEFVGWSSLPTNVTQHYKITPVYKIKYTINYYNGDERVYQCSVYQGDPAIDPVATGVISAPAKTGTDDISYLFSGWDNLPTNVQSSISVYALYDTYWAARFWNGDNLYLIEWVVDGGTVVEPKNYFEDYTVPTKVSTAQYDYHFSSWDGDFDSAMATARDFTATYTSTIRKYNVYFYNDTELLYTVEDVQYGSSASYSGSTPTKLGVDDPDEYVFKGWLPLPENITGETYCYALFKFTGYLFGKLGKTDDVDYGYGTVDNPNWDIINAYWATIASDVASYQNGSLSEEDFKAKYPIGGRMIIPIELSSGTVSADIEIAGYNHDNLADDSGTAPLTFFCVDLPNILRGMNETSTNEGGWEASEMREFVNGKLFDALPDELKSIIKPVYKISDGGSSNKSLITTADSCWLASYDEIGLTSGSNNLSGQGELYDSIFSNSKDSRKKYITDDTSTGGWWLRSSYYSLNSDSMFWRVTNSGGSYSDIAFNPFYVAFGFCI